MGWDYTADLWYSEQDLGELDVEAAGVGSELGRLGDAVVDWCVQSRSSKRMGNKVRTIGRDERLSQCRPKLSIPCSRFDAVPHGPIVVDAGR